MYNWLPPVYNEFLSDTLELKREVMEMHFFEWFRDKKKKKIIDFKQPNFLL